jgi:hypothetical protein
MSASPPFAARYPGHCAADCGNPILPGETVRYEDNELIHDGCVAFTEVPARSACPRCFIVPSISGACGCDE